MTFLLVMKEDPDLYGHSEEKAISSRLLFA
jgi:hypothetical protein